MSIAKKYLEEMHVKFGTLATWPPNKTLAVGDIGKLTVDGFDRRLGLKDIPGVTTAALAITPPDPPIDLYFASQGGVSIGGVVSATATPPNPVGTGRGQVAVRFNRKNAVLFTATSCRATRLANLQELERCILAARSATPPAWDSEYVVVTEVASVERATIIVANDAGASISLSLDGKVANPAIQLAHANVDLSAGATTSIGVQLVGAAGLTPLFIAHRVKNRLFRGPELVRRGVTEGVADGENGHGSDAYGLAAVGVNEIGA